MSELLNLIYIVAIVVLIITIFAVSINYLDRNKSNKIVENDNSKYIDDEYYNDIIGKFTNAIFDKEHLIAILFLMKQSWKSRILINSEFYLQLLSDQQACFSYVNNKTLNNPQKYEVFKAKHLKDINLVFENAVGSMVITTMFCGNTQKEFETALLDAMEEWEVSHGVVA